MPSASHEMLVAYLRQHGESHSLEALRKSLLRQGYDATAVDEACQVYVAETPNLYQEVSGVGWTLRISSPSEAFREEAALKERKETCDARHASPR